MSYATTQLRPLGRPGSTSMGLVTGSVTKAFVFGYSSESGFQAGYMETTGGGPSTFNAGGSAGVYCQYSTASNIYQLAGKSAEFNISGGPSVPGLLSPQFGGSFGGAPGYVYGEAFGGFGSGYIPVTFGSQFSMTTVKQLW